MEKLIKLFNSAIPYDNNINEKNMESISVEEYLNRKTKEKQKIIGLREEYHYFIGGCNMSIKGLDLLFDTDTLKNEEVEEISNFGLQLMELLEMKIKNMGLKIVDHNCITRV